MVATPLKMAAVSMTMAMYSHNLPSHSGYTSQAVGTTESTWLIQDGGQTIQYGVEDIGTTKNITSNITDVDFDVDDLLQRLSDQKASERLPAILVFSIMSLLGTVGNALVIYIYAVKFKPSSARSAILALAILDLVACCVSIPGEIVIIRYHYNFPSVVLCKILRVITTLVVLSSDMTLLVVAYDRYRKICRPLEKHWTTEQANRRVWVCVGLGGLLSIASVFGFGFRTFDVQVRVPEAIEEELQEVMTVQAVMCDDQKNDLALMLNSLHSLVFVTVTVAIIVFYSLLGRVVVKQSVMRRHRKFGNNLEVTSQISGQEKIQNGDALTPDTNVVSRQARPYIHVTTLSESTQDGSSAPGMSTDDVEIAPDGPTSDTEMTPQSITEDLEESTTHDFKNATSSTRTPGSKKNEKKATSKTNPRPASAAAAATAAKRTRVVTHSISDRTRRTTIILFAITVVFILSFTPYLTLRGLKRTKVDFFAQSATVENLYLIFVRSVFFNSIINCFVYGFGSPRFRGEGQRLVRRLFCCCCNWT